MDHDDLEALALTLYNPDPGLQGGGAERRWGRDVRREGPREEGLAGGG